MVNASPETCIYLLRVQKKCMLNRSAPGFSGDVSGTIGSKVWTGTKNQTAKIGYESNKG